MRCPYCARELVAERTSAGDLDAGPAGTAYVVAARCPYASCSRMVFGVVPSAAEPPAALVDRTTVARRYTRRLAAEVIDMLFGLAMALVFVVGPLAAMRTSIAHPASDAGRPLVLIGGILVALPSALFLAAGVGCAVESWRETRRRFVEVALGEHGGMRLVPQPDSYRTY